MPSSGTWHGILKSMALFFEGRDFLSLLLSPAQNLCSFWLTLLHIGPHIFIFDLSKTLYIQSKFCVKFVKSKDLSTCQSRKQVQTHIRNLSSEKFNILSPSREFPKPSFSPGPGPCDRSLGSSFLPHASQPGFCNKISPVLICKAIQFSTSPSLQTRFWASFCILHRSEIVLISKGPSTPGLDSQQHKQPELLKIEFSLAHRILRQSTLYTTVLSSNGIMHTLAIRNKSTRRLRVKGQSFFHLY